MSRATAVCWVLAANFFIVQLAVQAQWHTPYSLARNPISDLGAVRCAVSELSGYVCSPWHAVMNASFVATGLLIAGGTRWLAVSSAVSGLLIGLGGVGWILVGLFPADTALIPHTVGALLAFVPSNLGMLCYARRRRYRSVFLLSALGLLSAGVLLGVLPVFGAAARAINGAVERAAAWPFPLAAVICGLLYLHGATPRTARSDS